MITVDQDLKSFLLPCEETETREGWTLSSKGGAGPVFGGVSLVKTELLGKVCRCWRGRGTHSSGRCCCGCLWAAQSSNLQMSGGRLGGHSPIWHLGGKPFPVSCFHMGEQRVLNRHWD
jgi:hypothetical protein